MRCGSPRTIPTKSEVLAVLRGLWVAALALALWVGPLSAQEDAGPDPSPEAMADLEDSSVFIAPVEIDGEELFFVRGFTALPARERADNIQDRIIEAAEASDLPEIQIDIRDVEFGKEIRVDGQMITITTQADAEFEQVDLDVLAGLHLDAIQAAILTYRADRSSDARVGSAIAALAWTLVFLVVTGLFFRKRHWLVDLAGRTVEHRFAEVEEATKSVVRGRAVAAIVRYAINFLLWVSFLILFYYYLSFVLLAFAETRPLAQVLLTYVTEPLIAIGRGFLSYLPNLITLAIIAALTRWAIQGLRIFFDNLEEGMFDFVEFEKHWIAPTFFLARILIILIALVFAYPYIPGSDSAAFQGLTILAGVMLSLGSNTVVSNMMSGLFVIYRRSTNVGDRIRVGDKVGDVVEIKLMETMMKSVKNELISIPNSQLLNSEVVNYSRKVDGRGLMVHTTVGIGYEEPPAKIKAMLIEAAHRTRDLKASPAPFVLWTQLGDYAISYEINAFTSRGASLPRILSDLHENIVEIFNANGTQIMTPSYIADPDVPKIPQAAWDGELEGITETAEEPETKPA